MWGRIAQGAMGPATMKTTSDSKLKLLRVIVLVLAVGAYVGLGQESGRWNPGYLCAFHAIGLVLVFTIHLEVEGRWPWQPAPIPAEESAASDD